MKSGGGGQLRKEKITDETLLVGHCFGFAALMDFMAEEDVEIDRLVGVAPWFDPEHRYLGAGLPQIDPNMQARIQNGVDVFYSTEDSGEVLTSVGLVRQAIPSARMHNIPEYGHFLLGSSMRSEEFPELVALL